MTHDSVGLEVHEAIDGATLDVRLTAIACNLKRTLTINAARTA